MVNAFCLIIKITNLFLPFLALYLALWFLVCNVLCHFIAMPLITMLYLNFFNSAKSLNEGTLVVSYVAH